MEQVQLIDDYLVTHLERTIASLSILLVVFVLVILLRPQMRSLAELRPELQSSARVFDFPFESALPVMLVTTVPIHPAAPVMLWAMSLRVTQAASGAPFPIPFAMVTMSGTTP